MTNYYTKGFYEYAKVLIYFLTIRSRNIIIFKIIFLDSDFGSPEKNINEFMVSIYRRFTGQPFFIILSFNPF